jgi:hypothetical protein
MGKLVPGSPGYHPTFMHVPSTSSSLVNLGARRPVVVLAFATTISKMWGKLATPING